MRDPGTIRDQLWIVPYNQSEMTNLSIPATVSFPVREIDTNNEHILVLDNSHTLWCFKNFNNKDIELKKAVKDKVKYFKCWNEKVLVYQENNELMQVELSTLEIAPIKPGLCISVKQIACGK